MKWHDIRHLQRVALDTGAKSVHPVRKDPTSALGKEYVDPSRKDGETKAQVEIRMGEHDYGFERLSPELIEACAELGVGLIRTRPGRYQTTTDGEPCGDPHWEQESTVGEQVESELTDGGC